MTKLKIRVTKDILERSKYCGSHTEHCAVAQAVRDIFPKACVCHTHIFPFSIPFSGSPNDIIMNLGERNVIILPTAARDYILSFDRCSVEGRVNLPEFEFEVEISDQIIEKINIEELKPLLQNHPTLELIEN